MKVAQILQELHKGKKFHKKQTELLTALFRTKGEPAKKKAFIRKGRKGGGTYACLYPLVRIAACFPGSACYLIGPTLVSESEIVWNNRRLHNYIPREWNVIYKESEKRVVFPNGSFIKLEGADDPERLRGIEGDAFVWDEFKDHNRNSYEYCYPNIASRNALWMVLGSPPTKKESHYYELEMQIRNDPNWFFIHWSVWDNVENLPGGLEWIQNEKAKYYKNGNWDLWEVEWEARYVFNAKQKVLPDFNSDRHVVPEDLIQAKIARDKHHFKWFTVIDPGYATCFAVLFIAYNPYTTEFFVLREIYSTDRHSNSAEVIWPKIEAIQAELFDGKWINIYDNAALGFANEVRSRWKEKRISLIPTHKQNDDEDRYFRILNSAFATNRCLISEKCPNHISEIENYETDENDRYVDKKNHTLDDLRYFLKYVGYSMLEVNRDEIIPEEPSAHTFREDRKKKNNSLQLIETIEDDLYNVLDDNLYDPTRDDF